jgi:hypothetical protein
MNLVTPKAGAKHALLFNKPASALFTLNLGLLVPNIFKSHDLKILNINQ